MKKIKLLFFATIRDRAGTKSLELEIPGDMTGQELKCKVKGRQTAMELQRGFKCRFF